MIVLTQFKTNAVRSFFYGMNKRTPSSILTSRTQPQEGEFFVNCCQKTGPNETEHTEHSYLKTVLARSLSLLNNLNIINVLNSKTPSCNS